MKMYFILFLSILFFSSCNNKVIKDYTENSVEATMTNEFKIAKRNAYLWNVDVPIIFKSKKLNILECDFAIKYINVKDDNYTFSFKPVYKGDTLENVKDELFNHAFSVYKDSSNINNVYAGWKASYIISTRDSVNFTYSNDSSRVISIQKYTEELEEKSKIKIKELELNGLLVNEWVKEELSI